MKTLRFMAFATFTLMCSMCYADYTYLNVFDTSSNGTSLTVSGLKLIFSDGKLVAYNNGTQTQTFSLSDLDYMTFSDNATGIDEVDAASDDTYIIYNLNGYAVGKSEDGTIDSGTYPNGVYIIKGKNSTRKVVVE